MKFAVFAAVMVITSVGASAARSAESNALRNLVLDSQPRLGLTESWQVRIFNEEVAPHASRFIKDLKSEANAGSSVVDVENIRRYLTFFGPKVLKRDEKDMRLLTFVRSERECAACTVALIEVKRTIASRATSRGFTLSWPSAEDLGDPALAGNALEQALINKAKEVNAAGVLLVNLKRAPIDGIDTAGSELKRLQGEVFLLARGEQEYRYSGKLDVIGEQALSDSVPTLLTEAFLEFGSKIQADAVAGRNDGAPSEILLTVQGVQDFAKYQALKNRIEELLLAPAKAKSIEKRKISRGQVTFAIRTEKGSEEISKELKRGLASAPTATEGQPNLVGISVKSSDATSIQAELTVPATKGDAP